MAKKNTYDESNIQILEGLEAVRKRPGMYIGSTDSRGLHHLVWEIVDNAIDEALSGYGNLIEVTICKDNSIIVQDHGRGMPTGMHASGRPTTEVILTILHAGGKFSEDGGYKTSGGLHGVGASVVNALSHWLEVTVCRDGKIFKQRFEDGGETIGKLTVIGKTKETGTLIHFLPNDQIFSTIEFNYKTISERLMESAFLLKGIKIVLKDERTGKMDEFHFENGLEAFIDYLNTNKDVLHPTISIEGEQNGMEVDIALQFTSGYQETTLSFVNLVRTGDGGTHETGFKSGLTKTFNDYARKYGLLKEKDKNLEGNDVREGLSAIISIKVPEHYLQFEGQTKSKLGTPEARNIVDSIVYEKLSYFLEENKEIADNLVKKMIKAAQVRDAARKAREAARKGKGARQERILSGKLAPAQTKNKKKSNRSEENQKQEEQPKHLIVIDAGHQARGNNEKEPIGPGSTTTKPKVASGTAGKWSGLNEYELTLQISLKLKEALLKENYQVIMVRETNNVNISNSERAKIANDSKCDAFIRIHANGSENTNVNGAMTICQTSSNPYNSNLYEQSKKLSNCILDKYTEKTGIKKERVWETDIMSGINWCQVPVTILELGYMSNQTEDLKLADVNFQTQMVEGIIDGINQYFEE